MPRHNRSPEQKHGIDGTWDFRGAKTGAFTHGLHPYPARMVPGVAGELIRHYSTPGDLVYDPFCGSGTTLVEAVLGRRHASGLDLNPFAVMLSRVKTVAIDPEVLQEEWRGLRRRITRSFAPQRSKHAGNVCGRFLDLEYWYKPYVLRDLGFIRSCIDDSYPGRNSRIGNFLRIVLARTARQVSNQRPKEFKRWRRTEDALAEYQPHPILKFVENVERAIPMMADFYAEREPDVSCFVAEGDARVKSLPRKASLIVTSPPYGDSGTTVAYGQFSSFAFEWLRLYNLRPRALDRQPLGPLGDNTDCLSLSKDLSRTYSRIAAKDWNRAQYMLQFFDGMTKALANMRTSLCPSGFCCIVVGNRKVRGIDVQTDSILTELASETGFDLEEAFGRTVRNKVLPYATRPMNVLGGQHVQQTLRTESILVLRAS